jgi:hypothetical protein
MPHKTNGMPFEIHPSPMKGKDGKNILYVRPQSRLKVTMEDIDDYCSRHYALRPGELTRSLLTFIQAAGYFLSDGYRIETPLGWFAPKIGLRRELTNPDEVRSADVCFEGIEYRSAKEFEESVANWLDGFRRANNRNVQELMADKSLLDTALQQSLAALGGYTTARSFALHAGITYYSARKQLDRWCKGDNPRLLRSKHGQEIIYTEI